MKKILLLTGCAFVALGASAQEFKEGYVEWGYGGTEFGQVVSEWQKGTPICDDDNFFISRVKPRERFRNAATQVRSSLNETNDKKLLMWVPINGTKNNALPDGVYDSEVFNMWSYVTHYGNWTAPLGRVPGGFLDVAHKNGVAVSGVAGIPYGSLFQNPAWETCLETMVDAGAQKVADFHRYYGVDGLGYNSEFGGGAYIQSLLKPFHAELTQIARKDNPLFENLWYDGTNDNGIITFDQGLGDHNDETFGHGGAEAANLFLNYNWNSSYLLEKSVQKAKEINRSPLDLYAGVNMQGAEPGTNNWPLLKDYPISIGLWGAHSENMFWESRGEKGSEPDVKQRTYMLRTERWFTGGTRNPANCPAVSNSMKYNADNFNYHGMSSFMTARSSLKWDLGEEAFITYFNLGNGKYFNWQGVRQHDKAWYNIASQDYLPTWRWWFSKELLSGEADNVPAEGLDAEFTWDEAYVGGSSVRVFGSTADEYLHLFKTEYALQAGDVITMRYKLKSGKTKMNLVLTALGSEAVVADEAKYTLAKTSDEADEDVWVERQFTVGAELAGKSLALVALHFQGAENMDLYLGEFSIVRGTAYTPLLPAVVKAELLANSKYGVDGKIIFNMPNDKAPGEPCYNLDVNTAFFKLYAQQEGQEPVLMGFTTTWAGLVYNIPMNMKSADRVRLGVSAISLDHKAESGIAWSNYIDAPAYVFDDDIQISKNTIKPNEEFVMSYVDQRHEEATWVLVNVAGEEVFRGTGHTVACDGLKELGSYDLKLTGVTHNEGKTETTTRNFASFVQITSEGIGALPEIYTLTANDKEADIEVKAGDAVAMAYTGRAADGAGSQGVDLKEKRFGVKAADLDLVGAKSFSVSFWLKINKLADGETQLLAVANKVDEWPKTDWGWIWSNIQQDGSMGSFTWRGTDMTSNNELRYKYENTRIPVGNWVHIAYVFDYNSSGLFKGEFYVNGVKQEVTKWNRTKQDPNYTKGEPPYEKDVYNITKGQVISVGGSAHGRAGIDGVIDNFAVWNKAISAEEVKASMGDLSEDNLPADVLAFWALETQAGDDLTFASVGQKKGVAAGIHDYIASGGEGQGKFQWQEAAYTSGCPFISGTAYPVVTLPSWKAKKGVVTDVVGNGEAGSAKVTYAKDGDYEVVLTLANSLGQDQRTFRVIKVTGSTGIDAATADEAQVYTVDGAALVEVANAGNYSIRVYNAAGQVAAEKTQQLAAGTKVQLTLAQPGVYVVVVEKDGQAVRTVKLLNQ